MGTVTINNHTKNVIGTLDGATLYLEADPNLEPSWSAAALVPNRQASCLVLATRYFGMVKWKGTKTNVSQPLPWPRDGVTDGDGVAVTDGTTPTAIEEGAYLLAGLLNINPAVMGGGGAATQGAVREVSDGKGVTASFFYSGKAVEATRSARAAFPRDVLDTIRGYLGKSRAVAAEAFGTDGESAFDSDSDLFVLVGGL